MITNLTEFGRYHVETDPTQTPQDVILSTNCGECILDTTLLKSMPRGDGGVREVILLRVDNDSKEMGWKNYVSFEELVHHLEQRGYKFADAYSVAKVEEIMDRERSFSDLPYMTYWQIMEGGWGYLSFGDQNRWGDTLAMMVGERRIGNKRRGELHKNDTDTRAPTTGHRVPGRLIAVIKKEDKI